MKEEKQPPRYAYATRAMTRGVYHCLDALMHNRTTVCGCTVMHLYTLYHSPPENRTLCKLCQKKSH